jgi:hypothetical protein
MINMMSVKYAFSLSSVFCLDSASDASAFAGPGAEPAGPEATDWHCGATAAWGLQTDMTWYHDCSGSCQATGNNNTGTSLSAIEKKLKSISSYLQGRLLELTHFEEFFLDTFSSVSLWRRSGQRNGSFNAPSLSGCDKTREFQQHEKKSQGHKRIKQMLNAGTKRYL